MPLGARRAYYGKARTLISAAYLSGRTHRQVKVKVREAVCIPQNPAFTCPSLFKGSCSLLALAKPCLTYCVLWPYLVRQYLGFY